MPLVQIKGVAGYLSNDEKQTLIKCVTDAVVSVEGEALRPVTRVIVEDVALCAWGAGGRAIHGWSSAHWPAAAWAPLRPCAHPAHLGLRCFRVGRGRR